MKLWHKIAIGVGIFLFISCLAIGGVSYYVYQKGKGLYDSVASPEAKLKTAKEICDFTLPEGYDVTFAIPAIMDMRMAMITHSSTQQVFVMLQLPKESQISNKNFKAELESSKEKLLEKLNKGNSNSKIKEIKEVGNFTINGHEVPYCKAVFESNTGKVSDGIIANYECPISKKNFIVMAMAEPGKYDEAVTENFLKNLKCH